MDDSRDPTEHDLARLADGTLPPRKAAALEVRLAGSPELQARLAEQRSAIAATRGLSDTMPPHLRARIADRRARTRGRRRIGATAAGVATATAAAIAIAIVAPPAGRQQPRPTFLAAIAPATRPATLPAPPPYRGRPEALRLEVEDLDYPNWQPRFGWRATGARTDVVRGQRATTLFYSKGRARIAYTIVAAPPLPEPQDAAQTVRDGIALRSLDLAGGRHAVTWRRTEHTCVLSGRGVTVDALLRLGAWRAGGALAY